MTLSLAAVFHPAGVHARVARPHLPEFAVTIIVAIIASGVVSLTLTPLMCSRMLARHENKTHKPWMERQANRVLGAVISRYGRTLHFFLEHKWISAVAWIVCLLGTIVLFNAVPKSLLPTGDSSFIRGIFQAQEGTSPDQMHEYQNKVDAILRDDPAVDIGITVSGLTGRVSSSQAFMLGVFEAAGCSARRLKPWPAG